eukprot:3612956-Rhodomonas_salina.2
MEQVSTAQNGYVARGICEGLLPCELSRGLRLRAARDPDPGHLVDARYLSTRQCIAAYTCVGTGHGVAQAWAA